MKRLLRYLAPILVPLPLSAYQVPLLSAEASFEQASFPASKTVDGSTGLGNGWGVAPQTTSPHQIWWQTDGFVGADGLIMNYQFKLKFRGSSVNISYHMKKFRIRYTTDAVVSASSNWNVISPTTASTSSAANLLIGPNDFLTLSGAAPKGVDYIIDAGFDSGGLITGFSLEVETDGGFVGTGGNSNNFILTEFCVEIPSAQRTIVPEDIGEAPITWARPISSNNSSPIPVNVGNNASNPADYLNPLGQANVAGVPFTSLMPVVDDAQGEDIEYAHFQVEDAQGNLVIHTVYIVDNDSGMASYEDFVASYGLIGTRAEQLADPDGDGVNNLESYLFKFNPIGPESTAAWLRRPQPTTGNARGRRGMEFSIPAPLPSDVRIIALESEDLSTWNEVGRRKGYGIGTLWSGTNSSRVTDNPDGTGRKVLLTAPANTDLLPDFFFKLQFELFNNIGSD